VSGQFDIERRLPVWHAFSELFLDTELQPYDYRDIGKRLRASGYPREELKRILEDEVAPVFSSNLLSVAGEWTAWTEEEVEDIMKRSLRVRIGFSPFWWLRKRMFAGHLRAEWEKIPLD
jgi:hypothetical protein